MNRKVSVIVPVYRVMDYLDRCLKSIENQTFEELEIICVNDCSPDGSGAVLARHAAQDDRIRVITHTENRGLSAARNSGLAAATSEYVVFVDSDDWIDPDYIEKMVEAVESTQQPIAVNLSIVGEGSGWTIIDYKKDLGVSSPSPIRVPARKNICKLPCMAVMSIFDLGFLKDHAITFPVGMLHEDIFFQYVSYAYLNDICAFVGPRYHYFQNPDGIMSRASIATMLPVYKHAYRYLHARGLCELYEAQSWPLFAPWTISRADEYELLKSYYQEVRKSSTIGNGYECFLVQSLLQTCDFNEFARKYGTSPLATYLRSHIRDERRR